MKKPGNFLIEVLVYLSVSLFLAVVLYQAIIYSAQNYKSLVSSIHNNTNILKALNDLKSDIEFADPEKELWVVSDNKIVFPADLLKIEWSIEKNRLYRAEWGYNKQKVRNLIASNVESLVCSLNLISVPDKSVPDNSLQDKTDKMFDLVKSVKIELTSSRKYSMTVLLINGIYEIKE